MIRVGINGFGRIGRLAFRTILERNNIEVVAINDVLSIEYLAYLLKFDSVHGKLDASIVVENNYLVVNGHRVRISAEKSPENIAWDDVNVDYVLESTGLFTSYDQAKRHISGGAPKVAISAPSKDAPMFVMGVNHTELQKGDLVFSNASCTTNCLAPVLKVLNDNFGVLEGLVNTVHASTSSQNTVDGYQSKWRRGRSALVNMIPTSTSASEAVIRVMPEMDGKIKAMAVRVPIVDVSLVDLTVRLEQKTSYEAIKKAMKSASKNELNGILGYTEDEVVSQDFVSERRTSVFDANAGLALNAHFYKIIAWYDNEFGYANKIVDLILYSSRL